MKYLIITFFLLYVTENIFAQKYSVGFNYSQLISGSNYKTASAYTLECNYEILFRILNLGISATAVDALLPSHFLQNSSYAFEDGLKLGVTSKYYPYYYSGTTFSFKIFLGAELGAYVISNMKSTRSHTATCEETYRFEIPTDLYANFSIGSILFPEEGLSLVFSFQYQVRNPEVTYELPNCEPPYIEEKYTEKVNLNTLLWSVGFNINF